MAIALGIFLILHGFVHLLYAGHCRRLYSLSPGLQWPDGSWGLSRLLGNDATRTVVAALLLLAALGFAAGGLGLLIGLEAWRPVIVVASVFSSLLYIALWDGTGRALSGQGVFGLLINLAVLAVLLVLKWP